ncbi:hypothetical protein FORC11_p0200 (plasmid) [Shigella sonnei]|uniref:Uncharacterized protein n=2 Tax=Shigella TaxID=620 RepID=B2TT14_SHIB3|nr:hypothetical protein SbBS512_A0200 [Shigella boydii CDC 3083-94]ALZ58888.1 hypothetical protein FORC11_p0200 [Shigella sonnei]EFZ52223.1 hypothetical protein SS53G_3249 [Shigella sonnei 53G]ESU76086.1 hypothetical protein WRSd3_p00238 [Shigella dysenteriae WRSd3]ESU76760.1 hypothetical protein WRSd5_p00207 [Shigella dysenteriae WRSd5]
MYRRRDLIVRRLASTSLMELKVVMAGQLALSAGHEVL